MTKSAFIKKVIEEHAGTEGFDEIIKDLAHENFTLSRKLSKIFLKAFGKNYNVKTYLKALKRFLLIKDSL